jgi:hypothetical protein
MRRNNAFWIRIKGLTTRPTPTACSLHDPAMCSPAGGDQEGDARLPGGGYDSDAAGDSDADAGLPIPEGCFRTWSVRVNRDLSRLRLELTAHRLRARDCYGPGVRHCWRKARGTARLGSGHVMRNKYKTQGNLRISLCEPKSYRSILSTASGPAAC